MIKFFGPNQTQSAPVTATQITGFGSGYFSFGDPVANNVGVGYNRTISFTTDSESVRTAFTTGLRIPQGAAGFSSTNIYHINGYAAGLNTTKNKVLAASDSQSVVTISLTVERRGATNNLPHFTKSRIYLLGGYSDTLAQYRADGTYITTATDTATNTTAIPAGKHVSVGMYENNNAYVVGGLDSGGATTSTIYKYIMTTDTASTLTATDSVANAQGYSFSTTVVGYRINGTATGSTGNVKLNFSTETRSATTNSPEAGLQLYQGVSTVTSTVGYVWTGYRAVTLNRAYHKLTFSTETWANNSYTTADTNSGWITSDSGV